MLVMSGFHLSVLNQIQSNYNGESRETYTNTMKQILATGAKRGKTRVTKLWLVLILHLIGWVGQARDF